MKLYVRTFGCRANQYDTEAVLAAATAGGWQTVDDPGEADVAVFNSCAVTSEAERDVRKAVRRAASANPRLRTVVMGCSAALPESAKTLAALPTVERVVAGADVAAVSQVLGVEAANATVRQRGVRATLRIQDGCDEHCTFCATTLARGANRSRSPIDIVAEAKTLAVSHPEIVIVGTHIGTYGVDTGTSLGALLQRLVREVPEARFRLSSIEATEVDDALAALLRDPASGVVPHLHAPLQSGSDKLLKRMGRHWYSSRGYLDAVSRLVDGRPVFGLGADIIVGFPGETDEDFAMTEAVVRELPFTYLHVFSYSPRAGTAAPRLPDPVPLSVTHDRSHRLRHLAQEKAQAYRKSRAGGPADVVVISGGADGEALTEDYLTVGVAAPRPRAARFATRLASGDHGLVAT